MKKKFPKRSWISISKFWRRNLWISRKVQSEHGERFIDMLGHFDSVYKRFDRRGDEYHAVTHGLKRIEDQMDGDLTKRKEIEERFLELKRGLRATAENDPMGGRDPYSASRVVQKSF